jgi:predicted nucleotidyltransferase
MTSSDLIEHLPALLDDFPSIHLVYLFGSQVTGNVGPMSDYDLAILEEGGSGEDELALQARFQYAISKLLMTDRVDVVVINSAPIELAYEITATGTLLYQKDLYTRVEFEAQVLGKHGDYLPILKPFMQQIIQGDAHGKRVQRYREALGRTERTLGTARTFSRSPSE